MAMLRSLVPTRLIVRGTPSGKEYYVEPVGTLEVTDPQDLEYLLALAPKQPKNCGGCGSSLPKQINYFQEV